MAAILVGLTDGSLALVAFGAVQLFDFAADVVLVVHFRLGAAAEHMEHVVLRVVAAGLLAVGATTAVLSLVHLLNYDTTSDSGKSVVLASASVVALTVLAVRKRHLALRLPSRALRSDGTLSAVGAALAAVTVAGAAAETAFGWWWADPTAALLIGIGAVGASAVTSDS